MNNLKGRLSYFFKDESLDANTWNNNRCGLKRLPLRVLGEKDEAFDWLEKDFAERSYYPAYYAVDPTYDDLRDDPRFADLIRRVALAKMD